MSDINTDADRLFLQEYALPIPEIVKQGYRNALDEIDRLRKQLKACREAVEDYQKGVAEKDTDLAKLVDEIDRLREENTLLHRERGLAWGLAHIDEKERDSQIEQRTKQEMMEKYAIIPVTQGKATIIDRADYDAVRKYKWYAHSNGSGNYYVKRNGGKDGVIGLANSLMNPPEGLIVDHINGDGLDNRRENLRICTHAENMRNRRKLKQGRSQYKGVRLEPSGRWRAVIKYEGEMIHIGCFDTENQAAIAYNEKAVILFGKYAHLNIIKQAISNAEVT
jgi:hypothetical protein